MWKKYVNYGNSNFKMLYFILKIYALCKTYLPEFQVGLPPTQSLKSHLARLAFLALISRESLFMSFFSLGKSFHPSLPEKSWWAFEIQTIIKIQKVFLDPNLKHYPLKCISFIWNQLQRDFLFVGCKDQPRPAETSSQGLPLGLLYGGDCCFHGHWQQDESEEEQSGHKFAPIWDASITGNGSTHYATWLASQSVS